MSDLPANDPARCENRATCPACGNPIDYCQGHGELGDPVGREILARHDLGDHSCCARFGIDD